MTSSVKIEGVPTVAAGGGASLGGRLREAAAHTVVYGLGSVLQAALGFVLLPLYTRSFAAETYGVFAILTLVGTLGGTLFSLGAPSALARSYFDYERPEERRRVVGTSLQLVFSGGIAALLLAWALGGWVSVRLFDTPEYAPHVLVAVATTVVSQVTGILFTLLRLQRRSAVVIVANLASLVGTTALVWWLLVAQGLGLMGPLLGLLIGQGALALGLGVAARRELSFLPLARELPVQLRYGLPSVAAGLLYYALDSIDRVLISELVGLEDVGIYSLGYKLAMVIQIVLVQPFAQIWTPMRMEYRQDPSSRELFSLVLTYYAALGLCLTLAATAVAPEVVRLISGRPEYWPAFRVIPLVMVGHLLYGAMNLVDSGILYARRVEWHVLNFFLALLLNVGLNLLLIPRWGFMGAAVATLLSYAAVVALAGVVSHRFFPVSWEGRRLLALGATGGAALVVMGLLSSREGVVWLAARGAVAALVVAIWLVWLPTARERARAGAVLARAGAS